ncbi:hypothetical protein ACFL5Z_08560 [Planctomycetota bacterium]
MIRQTVAGVRETNAVRHLITESETTDIPYCSLELLTIATTAERIKYRGVLLSKPGDAKLRHYLVRLITAKKVLY